MKESGCVGTAVSGASGIRSRLACVMEKAVGVGVVGGVGLGVVGLGVVGVMEKAVGVVGVGVVEMVVE